MTKLIIRLWLFCAAVAYAGAYAPHPSVLTVKYRDQMLPVSKVIGTDPVVTFEGKEKRLRTPPTYLLQRAEAYGAGYVRFVKVSIGGAEMRVVATADEAQSSREASVSGPRAGASFIDAILRSKTAVKGGFMVVVVYNPASFTSSDAPAENEVLVHDIPELPAGQDVRVKFSAPLPSGLGSQRSFIQLFDDTGRELMTNGLDEPGRYYALRDRLELQEPMRRYVEKFRGENHGAVPVITAKPILPEGTPPPAGAITALLEVSPAGTVTSVDIRGTEDPAVRQSIADALGGWLFLPQLKAGVPVSTKVKVPLQF